MQGAEVGKMGREGGHLSSIDTADAPLPPSSTDSRVGEPGRSGCCLTATELSGTSVTPRCWLPAWNSWPPGSPMRSWSAAGCPLLLCTLRCSHPTVAAALRDKLCCVSRGLRSWTNIAGQPRQERVQRWKQGGGGGGGVNVAQSKLYTNKTWTKARLTLCLIHVRRWFVV